MSDIVTDIKTRVEVSSLDEALPAYRKLSGDAEPRFREFPQLRLAVVGVFILLERGSETPAPIAAAATLTVSDLTAAVEAFTQHGGEVLDGPVDTGAGHRTFVRDNDGNVFECFQPAA